MQLKSTGEDIWQKCWGFHLFEPEEHLTTPSITIILEKHACEINVKQHLPTSSIFVMDKLQFAVNAQPSMDTCPEPV